MLRTRTTWLLTVALALFLCLLGTQVQAQEKPADYQLAAGDAIRIQVFQNPDLTLETRVSDNGAITYPLIGAVQLGGLSIAQAEARISEALQRGGFLRQPQVSITLQQIRGSQISVLGQVNRPGRFPLETANTRLSDILAMAGGMTGSGDDKAIIIGLRDGQPFRKVIDIAAIYLDNRIADDMQMMAGDSVYVQRAPMFYIYGEAQRSGAYRIERGMTVMQALAQGGGPTGRGTDKKLRLYRKGPDGSIQQTKPDFVDLVQPDDVLYVDERLF